MELKNRVSPSRELSVKPHIPRINQDHHLPRLTYYTPPLVYLATMVHTIQGKQVGNIGFGLMGKSQYSHDIHTN